MNKVEEVARAICHDNEDCPFDELPENKPHWIRKRGEFGGRHRDINEPFKVDYIGMARAAIEAMKGATEHMVSAEVMKRTAEHTVPVGNGYLYGTIEPPTMFDAMLQAALDEEDK